MVPADSHRVTRAPRYSGCRYAASGFAHRTLTVCGVPFQTLALAASVQQRGPTTPTRPEPRRFGLFPVRSPLLGESFLFSLPAGTKMFQFPAFAPAESRWRAFSAPGCPIRRPADQRPFAPPRGLSQLITSFIACGSLGIRHAPLFSCLTPRTLPNTEGHGARANGYRPNAIRRTANPPGTPVAYLLYLSFHNSHSCLQFTLVSSTFYFVAFASNMSKNGVQNAARTPRQGQSGE